MNGELNFETFKYFLECYFNVSANYDELDRLINEFNSSENQKYRQQLRFELEQILQLDNWNVVQKFVKSYGMRNMNEEKLKWLILRILNNLK